MSSVRQNPTDQNNLSQWLLYNNQPCEIRKNILSSSVTVFGKAPSGANEADNVWQIWKQDKDPVTGSISIEFAQKGANNLIWLYNSTAFDPVPNPNGTPYAIQLDNDLVVDGTGLGTPVANITVLDVDNDVTSIVVQNDPDGKFQVSGTVLLLNDTVDIDDVAYQVTLRATDALGNTFDQLFGITVVDAAPPAVDPLGEISIYSEANVASATEDPILDYTVPAGNQFKMSIIDCFGENVGQFRVEIDGAAEGRKQTSSLYYETLFDFSDVVLVASTNIIVYARNDGGTAADFTVQLKGDQYAI